MAGFKIVGWAADRQGCGYWRIGLPFRELREQFGLDAPAGVVLEELAPSPGDIVVGQRISHPRSFSVWNQLKEGGARLVLDADDDFWNVHPSNRASEYWNHDALGRYEQAIGMAELVTASTEPLAQLMRRFHDNVHVIDNYVDAALLEHVRPRAERLTIGWAGSSSHIRDMNIVAPALRAVLAEFPEVDMHFIGHDFSDIVDRKSRHTGWVEEIVDYQRGIDFDIGLAPIAEFRFNRSKTALKALEYAALGIPVIASAYGPYPEFVRHGETGFLARTQADWVRHLRALILDEPMRLELGAAAKRLAAEHTVQGNAEKWVLAFGSII